MKYQTHIAGGIVLGVCASSFFDYPPAPTVIYYAGILIGSLLPDLDHTKSFLGKKLRFISKPLFKLVGHRTLTHSLFMIVLGLEMIRLSSYHPMVVGLTLGIISHILLDILTPQGVALLYPFSRKRYKLFIKF